MAWPTSTDYFEAVQVPASFSDPELKQGQVAANAIGLPRACTGNFADVYQFACPNQQTWAVKCFTREIAGLQQRYQLLSDHLQKVRFPFTVDFHYQPQGTRVRGQWFPMLKMRWVEGITLNTFVKENLDRPDRLRMLVPMWIKLAKQLREANIAHGDLQHGNVLLVPSQDGKSARLTLIDYDGMIVPALAQQPSGEVGHPSYQHPERLAKGLYNLDVDRFSHLVICCALQCLAVAGKSLWARYDNGDNLLFCKEDFADPASSALFRELWQLRDPLAHALVGNLILACRGPLAQVPAIDGLFAGEHPVPQLSAGQVAQVQTLFSKPLPTPPAAFVPTKPLAKPKAKVVPKGPKAGSDARVMMPTAAPVARVRTQSRPILLWVLLSGAAVVLSMIACAGVFGIFYFSGTPEKKAGILRITKVRWSMPDEQAEPGRNAHNLQVWIERVDCKGKVTITLKDLPPGVRAEVATLAPNADSVSVPFTVSLRTKPIRKEVKIFAECEEAGASTERSILLIVKEKQAAQDDAERLAKLAVAEKLLNEKMEREKSEKDLADKKALTVEEKVLGEWQLVKVAIAGKDDDVAEKNSVLVFEKDVIHMRENGQLKPGEDVTYRLDVTKMPIAFDLVPKMGMEKLQGILKVEGDSLTICFQFDPKGARPTTFAAEPTVIFMHLKRLKKHEREKSEKDLADKKALAEKLLNDKKPKSLPEQLVGEWRLFKQIHSGTDKISGIDAVVFTTKSMQHKPSGATFPLTLDTTKSPAMISLSTNVAIVKIEGDVLTICFSPSGQRQAPAQFVSPAGSGITLWQGTRVK